MSETRYACPCCGYRTYVLPAGGTMQLCPVCFWEDAPGEFPYNGSNQVSLMEGQRNYFSKGASEGRYRDAVRLPFPEEDRSPHWMSMDDLREKLIAFIEEAFADVELGDGVTLHQMDVIDDWGGEKEQLEARLKDPEIRWQQISSEKLSRFSRSMTFLDGPGFRFHLPAFMIHGLRTSYPDINKAEIDGVLWALHNGPQGEYYKDLIDFLSPVQKQCAAGFLHFFAACNYGCSSSDATAGLRQGWDEWTPRFIELASL